MADAGGGGKDGDRNPSVNNNAPSFAGGSTPDTFDPKAFGTTLFSDANRIYQQGPKNNPIPSFTDYSADTKNLIAQGRGNNASLRSGLLGQIANGGVNIGPDYKTGVVGDVASGKYLEQGGNPYLEKSLADSRDNILRDVGSQFTTSGRFGGGSYIDTAVDSLASNENNARLGQYNTDYRNMVEALGLQGGQDQGNLDRQIQARGLLDASTAQSLGYAGLLDSKAAEKTASDREMWTLMNDPGYAHVAKYINLLNGGNANENTNRPVGFWDILGGIGSAAGAIL